jgi:hypothetical protein
MADRQRLADRLLWRLSLLINPLVTESRLYHSTPSATQSQFASILIHLLAGRLTLHRVQN